MKTQLILASLLSLSAMSANATILTFESIGPGGLNTYGDNISGPGTGYSEGLGYTPDITLTFKPDPQWGQYSVYTSGYATLSSALGHGNYNVPGEIVFTPSNGVSVLLHGFDLATWLGVTYRTDIRVWDDNGSRDAPNLFSFDQSLLGNTVYKPLGQTLLADGALHLYISNLGSTGIDNISFGQAVVPVPAAVWLFGSAMLGLLGVSKRRV
jgi:hypothetical protein